MVLKYAALASADARWRLRLIVRDCPIPVGELCLVVLAHGIPAIDPRMLTCRDLRLHSVEVGYRLQSAGMNKRRLR